MSNDNSIDQLIELKIMVKNLTLADMIEQQNIRHHIEIIIKNKFGYTSRYLDELTETRFCFKSSSEQFFSSMYPSQLWEQGKKNWILLVDTLIEEIHKMPSISIGKIPNQQTISEGKGERIFIVHGHDNEMVQASAQLIVKLGFKPVILREQPNQGRTIIEKFEDYSDVPFAIVLFSPDDFGKAASEETLKPRPRQNVVFELGFFIGKLGREKVVVLHKVVENFEMLSDFQGVLFEPYKDGWEFKIAKEIKAAGFDVDLNQLS